MFTTYERGVQACKYLEYCDDDVNMYLFYIKDASWYLLGCYAATSV